MGRPGSEAGEEHLLFDIFIGKETNEANFESCLPKYVICIQQTLWFSEIVHEAWRNEVFHRPRDESIEVTFAEDKMYRQFASF